VVQVAATAVVAATVVVVLCLILLPFRKLSPVMVR
jgi:hypothetical protein